MGMSSTITRSLFCAAIIWLGAAVGAQGSIVVPECQLFSVDVNLDACASTGAGSNAESSSPAPSTDEDGNGHAYDRTTTQDAFSFGGSSTGTSSSSSNSSGGSNTYAVRSTNADLVTDPAVGWLPREQRFALPMPPGNELLRPPQEWNCNLG